MCNIDQSNVVEFARQAQGQAYDAYWNAFNAFGRGSQEELAATMVYDGTVIVLQNFLGMDAPCSSVDPITFGTFSDVWKDVYGVRPRSSTMSLPEVMAWLNAQNDVIPVGYDANEADDDGEWDDSWDETGRADPSIVDLSTVRPSSFQNHA